MALRIGRNLHTSENAVASIRRTYTTRNTQRTHHRPNSIGLYGRGYTAFPRRTPSGNSGSENIGFPGNPYKHPPALQDDGMREASPAAQALGYGRSSRARYLQTIQAANSRQIRTNAATSCAALV